MDFPLVDQLLSETIAPAQAAKPAVVANEPAPTPEPDKPTTEEPVQTPTPGTEPAKPIETPAAEAAPTPAQPVAVSEDAALDVLRIKAGNPNLTWEDILNPKPVVLTPEDVEAKVQKKKDDALKFGLEQNIITPQALKGYHTDLARPAHDIAMELFTAEQKKLDPTATPEDIAERFEEHFGLTQEDGDWRKTQGLATIEGMKNMYINHKYGDIQNIEGAYDEHQSEIQNAQQYTSTVNKAVSTFARNLDLVIEDVIEGGEKIQIKVPYVFTDEEINKVKDILLTPDMLNRIGSGGIDEAQMNKTISLSLKELAFDKIMASTARSYHAEMMARDLMDKKGIIPRTGDAAQINNGSRAADPLVDAIIAGTKKK